MLATTALAGTAYSQAPAQLWSWQMGTSAGDSINHMVADSSGGAFLCGNTSGSFAAPNAGLLDIWIGRTDSTGQLVWRQQFGTTQYDQAHALSNDGTGGFFVGGRTAGVLNPPSSGAGDVWIARYSRDGQLAWIRQFGGAGNDACFTMSPDSAGGTFLGGDTAGDMGPGTQGQTDAWLARYDADGQQQWLIQFGTPGLEVVRTSAPDGTGGVFIGGYTTGDFGAPNAGSFDAFLARVDAAGNLLWTRQLGTASTEFVYGVVVGGSGTVFIVGNTEGSLGAPSAGGFDIFLAAFTSSGDPLWTRQFGTSSPDYPLAASSDGAGGMLIAGDSGASLGGPSAGQYDAWFGRFNSAGTALWLRQIGTTGMDAATAVCAVSASEFRVAGYAGGALFGQHVGGADIWLAGWTFGQAPCAANCDASTSPPVLNIADFTCFLQRFAAGDSYANCDASTTPPQLNIADFTCFLQRFAAGCQ